MDPEAMVPSGLTLSLFRRVLSFLFFWAAAAQRPPGLPSVLLLASDAGACVGGQGVAAMPAAPRVASPMPPAVPGGAPAAAFGPSGAGEAGSPEGRGEKPPQTIRLNVCVWVGGRV